MEAEAIAGEEVWVLFKVDVLDAASATALGVFPLTADDTVGVGSGTRSFITAEEDPVLAALWDNDADDVFDSM